MNMHACVSKACPCSQAWKHPALTLPKQVSVNQRKAEWVTTAMLVSGRCSRVECGRTLCRIEMGC